jgi:hypothetical protein
VWCIDEVKTSIARGEVGDARTIFHGALGIINSDAQKRVGIGQTGQSSEDQLEVLMSN